MNVGDKITQVRLNTLIFKMLNVITFNTSLNLFAGLTNEFCELNVDFKKNIISGDEIIITEEFIITLINPIFTHLDYFLNLNYYELSVDVDNSKEGEVLKSKLVKLNEGENIIAFSNYPMYLQGGIDLIIKHEG